MCLKHDRNVYLTFLKTSYQFTGRTHRHFFTKEYFIYGGKLVVSRRCVTQEQGQSESSIDENVIHVNSVSLPTETTVEIPLGTEINFHVDLDKPPSYSDLFGKKSTFST